MPTYLVKPKPRKELSSSGKRVRKWVLAHRGIMRRLADGPPKVSPQFIHLVAYGKASVNGGHPVRVALKNAGCPVIE